MTQKPQFILGPRIKGLPISYECSVCGQIFILPEDRNPKEAATEVWAAFNEHVREVHADAA